MKRSRLLLAACLAGVGGPVSAATAPGMKAGTKAPPFSCPLLGEPGKAENVTLRELLAKSQVVLMSFFHTTCKPCIKEIPRLAKVAKDRDGKPLATYLVFVGTEDDEAVRAFLKTHGFSLPVLLDRHGLRIGEKYGVVRDDVAVVPQIMVVSKNGVVKAAWTGFPEGREAELAALLDRLFEEERAAPVAADTLTILFTNNTNGVTLPSPAIDVGGLARRATVIKRERAAAPASILVDAGDVFPTSPDEERSRRVLAAYELMGYDAVTIGEAEFVNGLAFLRGVAAGGKFPLVSVNVKAGGGQLAKPQMLLSAGKRKVAVVGYLHPDAIGFTPEERMSDGKGKVEIADPAEPVKAAVAKARKEADVVVVLSHAGVEADRQLAVDVPGIDVVVGAHSQTFLVDPAREGRTLIVQAAADGQYVGKLVLKFGEDGKPFPENHELIALTKNVPEDAAVRAAVTGAATKTKP